MNNSASLYKKLKQYAASDYYPFHMPGHKRNPAADFLPYEIDITEIENFDNLHHAKGILNDAMQRAAALYHAGRTFFLVNGSTSGLLTAISAVANGRAGTIIMARNCHKAVYHGVFINRLSVEYVYPKVYINNNFVLQGSIQPEDIMHILKKRQDILAVVLTSPTYDGIVSDVRAIAELTHQRHIPLIVDEAHGAHFGFHKQLPVSSVRCGADIVIQSLHKTLPSMTQSALLHFNGPFVLEKNIEKYEAIYQTSSPSYVMMAGMDSCIRFLEQEGADWFEKYMQQIQKFENKLQKHKLKHLKVCIKIERAPALFAKDPSKILIFTGNSGKSGKWLYEELLRKYHLQLEMAEGNYALAMTSIMDTEEGFLRLFHALEEIDSQLSKENDFCPFAPIFPRASIACSIFDAETAEGERLNISESIGRISKEYAYLYPPGSPLIAPGERISREAVELLKQYKTFNFSIEGLQDESAASIEVIKQ